MNIKVGTKIKLKSLAEIAANHEWKPNHGLSGFIINGIRITPEMLGLLGKTHEVQDVAGDITYVRDIDSTTGPWAIPKKIIESVEPMMVKGDVVKFNTYRQLMEDGATVRDNGSLQLENGGQIPPEYFDRLGSFHTSKGDCTEFHFHITDDTTRNWPYEIVDYIVKNENYLEAIKVLDGEAF